MEVYEVIKVSNNKSNVYGLQVICITALKTTKHLKCLLNINFLLGEMHCMWLDDFIESSFPFLSNKKSSRPPEACFCVKAVDAVLGKIQDSLPSSELMLLSVTIEVVVEGCRIKFSGPFGVFKVEGKALWFLLVAGITDSFLAPVHNNKTQNDREFN